MQRLALLAWVPQEFRRDRNLHAELLLQCIEDGRWIEPLDRHPPDGPLPSLPPHVSCALRRRRYMRQDRGRGGDASLLDLSEIHPSEEDACRGTSSQPRSRGRSCAMDPPQSLANVAAAAVGQMSIDGYDGGISAPPAYTALAARVMHLQDENRLLRRQLSQARSASRGCRSQLRKPARAQSSTPCSRSRRCADVGLRARGPFSGDVCTKTPPARQPAGIAPSFASEEWQVAPEPPAFPHASWKPRQPSVWECARLPAPLPGQADAAQRPPSPATPANAGLRGSSSPPRSAPRLQTPPRDAREAPPGDALDRRDATRTEPSATRAELPETRGEFLGTSSPLGPPPPEGDTEAFLRYLDAFQVRAEKLCELGPGARGTRAR